MRAAVLVLINGVPGAGKSRVAEAVVAERERSTVVDIDVLRTCFADWQTRPETMAAARNDAIDMIGRHLAAGADVVVAQYVGRSDFVAKLRSVAARHRAAWIEVLVDVDDDVAVSRFRSRRATLQRDGELHPESDVADNAVAETVQGASAALREPRTREPITPVDGSDLRRAALQIRELCDAHHRSAFVPFATTDGVVTIRSRTDSDRAPLVAMRDDVVARWLGNSSDNPTPMACIERDGIVVGWVDSDGEPLPHLNASQLNVGYALAPNVRGEGIATRAVCLLLHRLAVVGETRAATLLIDRDNHASLGVAARASFRVTEDIANNRLFTRDPPPLVFRRRGDHSAAPARRSW